MPEIITGTSKENPIDMSHYGSAASGGRAIYKIIENRFGGVDGDYFILNESTVTNANNSKKFRVLLIEDKDEVRHQIFFDISNWT